MLLQSTAMPSPCGLSPCPLRHDMFRTSEPPHLTAELLRLVVEMESFVSTQMRGSERRIVLGQMCYR